MDNKIATSAEAMEASVMMPTARVVHSDPDVHTVEQEPMPEALNKKPVDQKSPAEWAYQRLILYIQNFEKTLNNEEEVAMGFTDTGGGLLKIEGIGYFDPDIVTFYGKDQTGTRIQLVQHVTQLNVLLRSMPKAVDAVEPNRIGFRLAEALEEGASGKKPST
ncbi:DUF6173 family protein [Rhodobacteraceae bacterium]|nr:DUF6173 family protein [Paracoccaceae bacterium]